MANLVVLMPIAEIGFESSFLEKIELITPYEEDMTKGYGNDIYVIIKQWYTVIMGSSSCYNGFVLFYQI